MSFETKTILVVDDSSMVAYAVGCQAGCLGFRVVLAANGQEALQHLAATEFAAVISDVEMPVMGGFELCRNIRLLYPEIPVVMMSGLCDEERRQTALASGAKELFEKPVTVTQLAVALSQELLVTRSPSPVERRYAFAS